MDFSCLQGSSQRDKTSPEVGVIGQRVTYSNGLMDFEDAEASPPLVGATFREPIRAMRPVKGVFGSAAFSSCSGVLTSPLEGLRDNLTRAPADLPAQGVCGHFLSGAPHPDTRDKAEDTNMVGPPQAHTENDQTSERGGGGETQREREGEGERERENIDSVCTIQYLW
ncbi:hypothetical protein CRUP_019757 [Coryphaenoides rupestris]|nr:hypothetical protein CRUP_019757 [Coryphaenoides rupestris]